MRTAWSGLRRFHHVPAVAEMLQDIHKVPEKHRKNLVKQASQIRQCLIQGREYRDAAAVASLATKPVLLYYSIMSLALAQILFKGSGQDSLDMARKEHKHHGLVFEVDNSISKSYHLRDAARCLVARPMIVEGSRRGTFELWHRLAREEPLTGNTLAWSEHGYTTDHVTAIMLPEDKRIGFVDAGGMNLLEIMKSCPGLCTWLDELGVRSDVVRGSLKRTVNLDGTTLLEFLAHPDRLELISALKEAFKFSAADYDHIDASDIGAGFSLSISFKTADPIYINAPPACSWDSSELRFFPMKSVLNEFGNFYVGLYMLGNYARYYPDLWMNDVDMGSPLALAAEEYLSIAEARMALLTLSELSRTYHVVDS